MKRCVLACLMLTVIVGCGGNGEVRERESAAAPGSQAKPGKMTTSALPPLQVKETGWELDLLGEGAGAERCAVLVSAAKYANEPMRFNLDCAANDAKHMQQALINYAGFSKDNILVVADNDVVDTRIEAKIDEVASRLKGSGNLLLFYYTGHGCALPDGRRAFFTYDSTVGKDGVPKRVFTEDDVQKWLAEAKKKASVTTVALFDCCYVARGKSDPVELKAPSAWNPEPLKVADVVISSCAPRQAAWPTVDGEASLFTYHFCDALRQASRQSAASLDKVFELARQKTVAEKPLQTPTMDNRLQNVTLLSRANLRAVVAAYDGVTDMPLKGVQARFVDQQVTLPYAATGLPPGDYPIQVEADGYFRAFETMTLGRGNSGKRFCVRLMPLYAIIRGSVQNPDGTAPVGAKVRLLGSHGGLIEGYHQKQCVVTDSGEFAMRVAPQTRYPGVSVELASGRTVRIDLPPEPMEQSEGERRVSVYDVGITKLPAKAETLTELSFTSDDGRLVYSQAREYEAADQLRLALVNYEGAKGYAKGAGAARAIEEKMLGLYERQANRLLTQHHWQACQEWCKKGLKAFPSATTLQRIQRRAEQEDIPEKVRQLWSAGMTAMAGGDLDAAERSFETAFPDANYHYKALMAKSLGFIYQEQFKKHYVLTHQHFRSEEWDKSARALARCLKYKPDFVGLAALRDILLEKPEVSGDAALAAALRKPAEVVEELGSGGGYGAPKIELDLGGGVKMTLVRIPAGEFMMGSDDGSDDEKPVHKVRITKPFYMSVTEVTNAQYQQFLKETGYDGSREADSDYMRHHRDWKQYASTEPTFPMVCVSWMNAVKFCEWLGKKSGRSVGLPTEAEWEYACRAGSTTAYCFGSSENSLREYGWYGGNSGRKTHPVGQKKPNAWGLYDMHGNVWEWCRDWYASDYYDKSPVDDPTGPQNGEYRVLRGGAWGRSASYCRSASRGDGTPSNTYGSFGFRVVSRDFQ